MALWDWTLAAYGREGTPQATLTLQDQHGQNTSFLLWAVWGGVDDPALLAKAADITRRFSETALVPIRNVRIALKGPVEGVDDAAKNALREDVKKAELAAEKLLMESLEALVGTAKGAAAPDAALAAAVKAWGVPASADALGVLARALA
jgi:uncharacterized protein (TIGR02444 family)